MTGTYRILYVDDEPALLEIVRLYLEKKKRFSVDTAVSAGEALAKMEGSPPYDAIVSDYQMPVMDGIEFLRVLRRRGDDIPFIIFTGKGREDVVIQALNEGADFYLQKGGDPASQFAELTHVIQRVVRQRRVEASIRDMERREADILNFLPDATFAIDLRGTVIAWNRAMERMTGIPAHQILGKGNFEYALPFYRERRPILIDLVLARDPETEAKYPYIRREGDTLVSEIHIPHLNEGKGAHLWFLASPLYSSRGEITGAIESIRDVSTWKNLEENFRERERFFSTLIFNLPGFVYRCRNDRDWTMEFVSAGCLELTGYLPEDLIGNATVAFNDIIHPDFRENIWNTWQDLLRERRVFEFEYPIITRSGETRWVWERGQGVFDEAGNLLYLEGFITDVTGRKNAEIALRRSEQMYRSLLENLPEQILVHRDGIILYANPATQKTFGFSPAEMVSRHVLEFVPREHHARVIESLRRRAAGLPVETYETELLDRAGRRRTVNVSGSPVTFEGGPATLLVLFDITERKQAEEALRQAHRKLALLASVTRHDINNQLMVLGGFLDLLRDSDRAADQEQILDKARGAVSRILQTIQLTRDCEQIGGRAPEWQDIHDLVEAAGADYASSAITIANDVPPGLRVFSDPMMGRVFSNLIDNAIRHGGDATAIRFSAVREGDALVIACEDDGAGVPEGEKEKIFARGYGKNTGWGLFLSREILAITGMSIHEEGEPGKGARFLITVPAGSWQHATVLRGEGTAGDALPEN